MFPYILASLAVSLDLVIAAAAYDQNAPHPRFEVASVSSRARIYFRRGRTAHIEE